MADPILVSRTYVGPHSKGIARPADVAFTRGVPVMVTPEVAAHLDAAGDWSESTELVGDGSGEALPDATDDPGPSEAPARKPRNRKPNPQGDTPDHKEP